MSNDESLPLAEVLKTLREDIHAEDTLIASRVTWYVTSQAFLLTAYAASWGAGFQWPAFFHTVLPLAAVVLSALIFASIYAATWAQDVYLREQVTLVERIKAEIRLSMSETLALRVYERTMAANRRAEWSAAESMRSYASRRSSCRSASRCCGCMRTVSRRTVKIRQMRNPDAARHLHAPNDGFLVVLKSPCAALGRARASG